MFHLSVGISEKGYPFSDNRTLNFEGVAPPHIKGGETAMWYPFELTRCPSPTEIPNCLIKPNVCITPIYILSGCKKKYSSRIFDKIMLDFFIQKTSCEDF